MNREHIYIITPVVFFKIIYFTLDNGGPILKSYILYNYKF